MTLLPDLRFAGRLFSRAPLFTVTTVLSLAVGIAGSTAIFSVADALLWRARPGVTNPATLVDIGRSTNGQGSDNFGYPLFESMRTHTTTLSSIAAYRFGPSVMSLGDAQGAERVFASLVSWNYFTVVGTTPAAGRFFVADEDRIPDARPVVVLSHAFWTRRFARNPDIVGTQLRLNNRPYTVVGVAEEGFTGTSLFGTDFWVPMAMDAHVSASDTSALANHNAVWHVAIGRLRDGVTAAQARDELHAIMQNYLTSRGDARSARWGVAVTPSRRLPAEVAGPVMGFVGMLGAFTLLVLIIACTNVASMLVARGLDRRHELAARLAVGASRARLVRQLLIEGLALSLLAGLVSIPIAAMLVGLLTSYQPGLPFPVAVDPRIDPRVHAVAFGLSALAALAFSLLPAIQTTRVDVMSTLRGMTSGADRKRAWLRQVLVGGQMAVALLLMIAAGLFLRSLQHAANIDVGFTIANVDTLQIDTAIGGYRTDADGYRAVEALTERFRALPGVTSVAASRLVPLQGTRIGFGSLRAPGYAGPDGTDQVPASWDTVSPDFFRTLQIPIVEGRPFDARDRAGAPLAIVVNQTLANRVWPGQSAVGRTLVLREDGTPMEVVGVVRDTLRHNYTDGPENLVYAALAQRFDANVTFYVRRPPGHSLAAEMRRAVVAFDPMLPVVHTETLESATALGLLPQRLAAWIAGAVAAIGLFLVAIGIYGLMAFSVSQRRREMAIRVAVGAPASAVLWLILRQAALITAAGASAGLVLAAISSTLLGGLLIGMRPLDPIAFGASAALLVAIVAAAAWPPARRAAKTSPLDALKMH